jgi:valyl-tRNA synthetase
MPETSPNPILERDFDSLSTSDQYKWLQAKYPDAEIDWDYIHNVQICERSKTVIEPLISTEWFVKMTAEGGIRDKTLIKLNTTNEIKFYPERFQGQAQDFLEKLKDWVISRNLWWGHRFPVWYCMECNPNKEFFEPSEYQKNDEGQLIPPKGILIWSYLGSPTSCPCCKSANLSQDERTLDTWFSSSLWPLIMTGFDFENYLNEQESTHKYR